MPLDKTFPLPETKTPWPQKVDSLLPQRVLLLGGSQIAADVESYLETLHTYRPYIEACGHSVEFAEAYTREGVLSTLEESFKSQGAEVIFNYFQNAYEAPGWMESILAEGAIPALWKHPFGASIPNDKSFSCYLVQHLGIPCPKTLALSIEAYLDSENNPLYNTFPHILKPRCANNSYGLHFIQSREEMKEAVRYWKTELWGGKQVVVQEYIRDGQDTHVSVLGGKAFSVIQTTCEQPVLFYENKFETKKDRPYKDVADLPTDTYHLALNYAEKIYAFLGFTTELVRVDFLYNAEEDELYFLEVEAPPGMAIQGTPAIAGLQMMGWSVEEICQYMIHSALERG